MRKEGGGGAAGLQEAKPLSLKMEEGAGQEGTWLTLTFNCCRCLFSKALWLYILKQPETLWHGNDEGRSFTRAVIFFYLVGTPFSTFQWKGFGLGFFFSPPPTFPSFDCILFCYHFFFILFFFGRHVSRAFPHIFLAVVNTHLTHLPLWLFTGPTPVALRI